MSQAVLGQIDNSAPTEARQTSNHRLSVTWWAAIGLSLLAFLPMVVDYFRDLSHREHYSFAPLMLLGGLALLYDRFRGGVKWQSGAISVWHWLWMALVGLILAGSVLFYSRWLAFAGFLVFLPPMIHAIGGPVVLRACMPVWVLLLSLLRPPMGYDLVLIQAMQSGTAACASLMLDLYGLTHALKGHTVQIAGHQLLVDEACSGINSLFSVLIGTLLLGLLLRRKALYLVLLLGAAVFWVFLGNAVRVAAVAVLKDRWGIDAEAGMAHTLLGFTTFGLTLLMVASSDQFLQFLWPQTLPYRTLRSNSRSNSASKARPAADKADASQANEPPRRGHRSSAALPAFLAVGSLALLGLQGPQLLARLQPAESRSATALSVPELGQALLPERFSLWNRSGYDTVTRGEEDDWTLANFSQIWHYRDGQRYLSASLNYPYQAWHDLSICYNLAGWRVTEERSADRQTGLLIAQSEDRSIYLLVLFGFVDAATGEQIPNRKLYESTSLMQRLMVRLEEGVALPGQANEATNHLQFQFVVKQHSRFDSDQIDRLQGYYERLRDKVFRGALGGSADP